MSDKKKILEITQNSDLGEKQKEAIKLLLDYERDLTQEKIASEVGISRKQLYNWRKFDEEFKRVKSELTDKNLAEYLDQIDKALVRKARDGSVRAMELFYKRTENLVDRKEVEHKGGFDLTTLHKQAKQNGD